MTPEQQAEYDALPWVWFIWSDDDDRDAYDEGYVGTTCVECGDVFEVGTRVVEKDGTIDIWHEQHAPTLARKCHPEYRYAEAYES